ncbi:hypothetical protein HanPI659440_Chr12g0466931 [Helianthus annuus]|nr:hypothetical protein HanPI659440_Chr12g0466931 [Helianthus annuus]
MNTNLLMKWWWTYKNKTESESLWKQVILAIHSQLRAQPYQTYISNFILN